MSLYSELKRRNVLRVAAAYIVTAWLIVQVVETLLPIYGMPDAAVRLVVNLLAIGLVPALVLAWVFEWTPEGLKKDEDPDHQRPASLKAAKQVDRMEIISEAPPPKSLTKPRLERAVRGALKVPKTRYS